ncbi:MAG: hypothetical protein IT578_00655 [Verrucomicrobiae bacterium]|nr:hypothetical protein [Verrucomicrobiae bacterium]
MNATDKTLPPPRRLASWWSTVEDLQWPRKPIRDRILRKADLLAGARVDTVVQFGFHFRFDFAWCFGAIHGYLAAVAEALHERGIRFVDHYSCNLVARPRGDAERLRYHDNQPHHVAIYPDTVAAETAVYAGHRLNDLREIDLVTGEPAYCAYNAEVFCLNNPDFVATHRAYVERLFREVPLDGLMADDMGLYNLFRCCGCRHCRKMFRDATGQDLPPISNREFWGDISGKAWDWGNYGNPLFRHWVQLRYAYIRRHLEHVREWIGRDKVLMTCCSSSGERILNSLALSNENFVHVLDWVLLENTGIGVETARWKERAVAANLEWSIARSRPEKPAPAVILSYAVYEDAAYLGWALARFMGVANWYSSFTAGLQEPPPDLTEDPDGFILAYNQWEHRRDGAQGRGAPTTDLRIVFARANKENGWKDVAGLDHWSRVKRWGHACLDANVGFRFLLTGELEDPEALRSGGTPVVLDGCAHVSDTAFEALRRFAKGGGEVWWVAPFGTHRETGEPRARPLAEDLRALAAAEAKVIEVDGVEEPAAAVVRFIAEGRLKPSVRVNGAGGAWKARLFRGEDGWSLRLLNAQVEGIEHPSVIARGGHHKVMQRLVSRAPQEPLAIEIVVPKNSGVARLRADSPEWDEPREVRAEAAGEGVLRFSVDIRKVRLYAEIAPERQAP